MAHKKGDFCVMSRNWKKVGLLRFVSSTKSKDKKLWRNSVNHISNNTVRGEVTRNFKHKEELHIRIVGFEYLSVYQMWAISFT